MRDHVRHPFSIDRGTARVGLERNEDEHIAQMVRQLLLTSLGERIFRPGVGCGIRRMVFAPNSIISAQLSQVAVHQALTTHLGDRIRVDDVKVQAVEEVLEVRIAYTIRDRGERKYLNLEVTL